MITFIWDDNLVTGLHDVDEQHHLLVDLFNELNKSFLQPDGSQSGGDEQVFKRLINYANQHFTDEEALMDASGLDKRHIQFHKQAPRTFVKQVNTMWRRRQQLSRPAETIIGFLTSWLGMHVLGIDQSMARQITSIKQGLSSADAFERERKDSDKAMQAMLRMVGSLYHVLSEQNDDLASANETLEERVRERTAALHATNEELLRANEQLKAFSRTDGLLGIPNRAYLDERIQEELATAQRQRWPLSVLMMDVDYFKRYNDTYGHQAGDACLQAVARAAQKALPRATDFLARYGGEELAVLLPDTSTHDAIRVANRILQAVQALEIEHKASDAAPHVTLSIGVATVVPTRREDGANVFQRADEALYKAKHAGRNQVSTACATAPTA